MQFDPPGVRVSRMEEALHIIKGLCADGRVTFSGTYYQVTALEGFPKPIQPPHPPILVGGDGKRVLSMAAREATIVGCSPIVRPDGRDQELTDATPEAVSPKVDSGRHEAGGR